MMGVEKKPDWRSGTPHCFDAGCLEGRKWPLTTSGVEAIEDDVIGPEYVRIGGNRKINITKCNSWHGTSTVRKKKNQSLEFHPVNGHRSLRRQPDHDSFCPWIYVGSK
jgi:hypothetical protein